jgi:hypothetical protein
MSSLTPHIAETLSPWSRRAVVLLASSGCACPGDLVFIFLGVLALVLALLAS